ncbi:glycosyltransferase [[Phormidium] sp. ETS-05]|uniref:glycosyltransferase family protein n=1 Tax=[Phormidium] sp. ETS-05 TaxID=222819 RepID=UPI0018EED571|nr:glycosyltransferase [[Phormidium] sp. ETS-05]
MTHQIIQFLPPDAEIIITVGNNAIRTEYQRINPQCQVITIDENDNPDISPNTVDCLAFDGIIPPQLLANSAIWLKPNGQVLARVPNLQYWLQIVNLLQGNWAASPTQRFTLPEIKQMFAAAGLRLYEIQTLGEQTAEFQRNVGWAGLLNSELLPVNRSVALPTLQPTTAEFQRFLQLMTPVINRLGIDAGAFATQTGAAEYLIRAIKSPTPPRRLLIQTNMMGSWPVYRIRTLEPDRFSRTIPGVRTVSLVKSADLKVGLPGEEKVFIWQRSILRYPQDIPLLKQLLQRDYLIVAETDDDPLYRPEYEQGQFLNFRGCHCVQTSTEPLAAYLRQHNPNVAVFPNHLAYLPRFVVGLQPKKNDEVTLFFGAFRRESDWAPIMPGLNRVLTRCKTGVRVKVIYDRSFWEALETSEKEFEPLCEYDRYQEILRSCDIALLPLLPTRFNQMKSDLKFLECCSHGVAVLASPTVYDQSIIEGETGLIYRSETEFETMLAQLIADTSLRQRLATNAYHWVAQNRLLCQHYRQRRDWYLQMRDQLPRLNQELRSRVPELFE